MNEKGRRLELLTVILMATLPIFHGCWRSSPRQVVVYTALDREFSQPVFDAFRQQTGIQVLAKFDTESTKTVGLANAILAEARRPRCDVFWNNEILNTLRLQEQDLLQPYAAEAGQKFPAEFRSRENKWFGFAARARVLIVNTDLVDGAQLPQSVFDLANPQWKDRVGIAKPLFGTTATHAAVLFHVLGAEPASEFFRNVRQNCQIMSGNKGVAVAVARGQLAWGLTDTDDAMIEIAKGLPVKIVYPDQQPEGMGTLFIPNTVALIRNSRHSTSAKILLEFLLSPAVEEMLAEGPSAQIPLNGEINLPCRVATPSSIRALQVDFEAAAKMWAPAAQFLKQEFMSSKSASVTSF